MTPLEWRARISVLLLTTRRNRDLTRRQAARATGFPTATIRSWETGHRSPSFLDAALYLERLGVFAVVSVHDPRTPDGEEMAGRVLPCPSLEDYDAM